MKDIVAYIRHIAVRQGGCADITYHSKARMDVIECAGCFPRPTGSHSIGSGALNNKSE